MICGYGLQKEGVKFLGVIINDNFDWRLHTNQVKKNRKRELSIMEIEKQTINENEESNIGMRALSGLILLIA